jgi:predicted nucleotidyltransferase
MTITFVTPGRLSVNLIELSRFVHTIGLITEYNPFHNGHLHHLQESLRITGAEASVAVMSGHFLQRGEPALLDKWTRAEMALTAGVDLVLELPFAFACNSAPYFAQGAVQSLDALGVVDGLCFGSEAGAIDPLNRAARLLVDAANEVAAGTAGSLRQGLSYPAARAKVLTGLAPDLPPGLLASPNNILAIEYLRALQLNASPMRPWTIPRLGAGFHSIDVSGHIASATGIRKLIGAGGAVEHLLPTACGQILKRALGDGRCLDQERLLTVLQALLLQETESLRGIYQVEHGLERRITEKAMTAATFADLVDAIKSRQWTQTRIQRMLIFVLLQVTDDEMRDFLRQGPMYLRLLGVTARGREVLARARKKKTLPVIGDPSRARAALRRFYHDQPESCRLAERMLGCDLRATRLYGLLQSTQRDVHRNQDFFQPVRWV